MVTGKELRSCREARGWSREDLARELGYPAVLTGVRAISRWESGETRQPRSPRYYEAVRLLTGVEETTLASLAAALEHVDERLGHVEATLNELMRAVRHQDEALKKGSVVARLDEAQIRQLIEAVTGPFAPERFLKRGQQAHHVGGVGVEPTELGVVADATS